VKRLLALLVLSCVSLFAQRVVPAFSAHKTTALSGAVEKVTIQSPASGGKRVRPIYATVRSTAAAVVTISRNGTAASSTTLAPFTLTKGATATCTAWHTSNAGAGTTVETRSLAADQTETFNLSRHFWDGNGATQNLSIGTDSITATVNITIVWEEDN
jgi:hypothetical protein